jgi:hypothetical protein
MRSLIPLVRSGSSLCVGALALFSVAVQTFAADTISEAILENDGKALLITLGSKTVRYPAPEGKFWDHLVLSGDKQKAFVALQRGSRSGSWHEDIHEFSSTEYAAHSPTYQLRRIPLVSTLKEASVDEVFAASKDGARLLISIHYADAVTAFSKSYKQYPYFFNTATGEVTIVEP